MKYKNLYIKACFVLKLPINFTYFYHRRHVWTPRHVSSHRSTSFYSTAIHQSNANATTSSSWLVTVQDYSLVRVSVSKFGTKSQATQERVPQGGASIPQPFYTWIIWRSPTRPIHWHQSGNGPEWRQQGHKKRKGMEDTVKQPIHSWLQLNLADKALQFQVRRYLRCGTYAGVFIHSLPTIWSTTFSALTQPAAQQPQHQHYLPTVLVHLRVHWIRRQNVRPISVV